MYGGHETYYNIGQMFAEPIQHLCQFGLCFVGNMGWMFWFCETRHTMSHAWGLDIGLIECFLCKMKYGGVIADCPKLDMVTVLKSPIIALSFNAFSNISGIIYN